MNTPSLHLFLVRVLTQLPPVQLVLLAATAEHSTGDEWHLQKKVTEGITCYSRSGYWMAASELEDRGFLNVRKSFPVRNQRGRPPIEIQITEAGRAFISLSQS